MPVIEQTPVNSHVANGVTTIFSFSFKAILSADILVTVDGVEQTLSTDYTLTGIGADNGGTVVFLSPPINGAKVVIQRDMEINRETDYQDNGDFLAQTVDDDFDRIVLLLQQVNSRIKSTIKLPIESPDQLINETPAERASKIIGFDAAGNVILYTPETGTSLIDLSASSGTNLIGHIASYTNTRPRALTSKLDDFLTVFDFLTEAEIASVKAKDYLVNVTVNVHRAITEASIKGKRLIFPSGGYLLTDLILIGGLDIEGEGWNNTELRFTGGTYGLQVTLNNPAHTLSATEMTITTTGVGVGYGLDVNYVVLGFDNRDGLRVETSNLHFRGATDDNGWLREMRLTNINGSRHYAPWFLGINAGTADNSEAENTVSPIAVEIAGTVFPTDHVFIAPSFYSFDTCFDIAGAAEGVTIESPVAVNVGRLGTWTPALGFGGRPGFKLLNPHVNSYKGVFNLDGIQQVQIEGSEVYHNPGATSNWIGYDFNNVIDGNMYANGYFRYADGVMTSTALRVTGSSTANIVVDGDIFGGLYTVLDTAIILGNNLPRGAVTITEDCRFNGTYRVTDISILGNPQVLASRKLLLAQTTGQSIPNNTETTLAFDTEEYNPLTISTTGGSITIPARQNIRQIEVTANVLWAANATGTRELRIYRNASLVAVDARAATAGNSSGSLSRTLTVTGGDVITARVLQTSGGALSTQGSALTSLQVNILT
jgi:hypothetical protein